MVFRRVEGVVEGSIASVRRDGEAGKLLDTGFAGAGPVDEGRAGDCEAAGYVRPTRTAPPTATTARIKGTRIARFL